MSRVRLLFTCLVSLFIASCATTGKIDKKMTATNAFEKRIGAKKGLTKEQLISEIGIPDKEYKSESFEIVEYNQSSTVRLPNTSTSIIYGNQVHTSTTNNSFNVYCKLEFKLVNGVVVNYRYSGELCKSYW